MICVSCNSITCTAIASGNIPTNTSDKTVIITFYNQLSSLVWHIPKYNVLIIGGDMNVQTGNNSKKD